MRSPGENGAMRVPFLFPIPPAAVPAGAAPVLRVGRIRAILAQWSARFGDAVVAAVGDAIVAAALHLSSGAAPVLPLADALLRPRRNLRVCCALRRSGLHPLRELRRIWFARTMREAFRILAARGLTEALLRRVVVVGNAAAMEGPAVLAVYHTPWARLLALWLSASGRIMLFAGELWSSRAAGAHVTSNAGGMRQLLRELRHGRAAAVTIDHFGERGRVTHGTEVLGIRVEACVGAARLAARAGVPLVPVALRWHRGRLEIRPGHRFTVTRPAVGAATGAVVSEFNRALVSDISSWANAHRFLASRHDRPVGHRTLGVKEHDVARSGNSAQDQDL